jgi:unsaturated rhamnogalacturonyl hydrolase
MFIRGFEGAVIDDIRFNNCTFTGVTDTEVLTHTGAVTLKNVTILPAKAVRGLNSVPAPAATTNNPPTQ